MRPAPRDSRDSIDLGEIILASTSPRRMEILRGMPLRFKTCGPEAEELDASVCSNERLPVINARRKSESVAARFPDKLVLGADTVVMLDDRIIEKPESESEALEILLSLSGRAHVVVTGVCLTRLSDNLSCVFTERSEVLFKKFGPETAMDYIRSVHVMDKAGAYAVQECGNVIIERISGSISNVMGLPSEKLSEALRNISSMP